jgi:hypothetical protein
VVCRYALVVVNADVVAHILSGADGADNGLGISALEMEVQMVAAVEAAPAMEFVSHNSCLLIVCLFVNP